MRDELESRMKTLSQEIRGIRAYLGYLEEIAHNLEERIEQIQARELVLEELLSWMGTDYKYRDMSESEKRQFDLIGAHLHMLIREHQIKLKKRDDHE